MPRLKKYLSDYRRPTLAWSRSDDARSSMEQRYLKWLAEERGWITDEPEPCKRCAGSGRERWYGGGRWKQARCSTCNGSGHKPGSDTPRPDTNLAASYVARQRGDLERKVISAVDIARWALLVRGAEPVTRREYRHRYENVWHQRDEYDEGMPEEYEGHHNTIDCGVVEWHGEREDLLRYEGKIIYLGIAPRHGGWDRQHNPHDVALIFTPGMAPTEAEVIRAVDDLLDTLAPADLLLAAE